MYDTMIKVFAERKTSWDQMSYTTQYIVYSLANGRPINVGNLIMNELTCGLGKLTAKRGNEIFFPRFIQSVLNYKNAQLIDLEGIDTQIIGYSKTISKVLFGSWDAKNHVDVPLGITPRMRVIFEQYPLAQPIYFSLSMEKAHLAEVVQIQLPKISLTHP